MVRAKFHCQSVKRYAHGFDEVELTACTGDGSEDDPNKSWSKWTPDGSLKMTITNPDAVGSFKPGTDYYLDIHEAGEPAPTG